MTSASGLNKKIIIKKFGGATVASPEQIKEVAARIKQDSSHGDQLIIVVSAMGKTTNNLIELANQVSSHPNQREMDMLLSVGERISMSLLSMALLDLGLQAISFTGSQAGILTNESHENAMVIDLKPFRILEEVKNNKIIILAGFQGVSHLRKEITTLGRGGTDTSAVAISAALCATHCEILKDVPAIYSADPRLVPNAIALMSLCYEELMEITYWGAKVLHYRSAELAAVRKVPLYIGPSKIVSTKAKDAGSWIKLYKNKELEMILSSDGDKFESARVLSINAFNEILKIQIASDSLAGALTKLKTEFQKNEIIFPQIIHVETHGLNNFVFYITSAQEMLSLIKKSKFSFDTIDDNISSIALTCTGLLSFEVHENVFNKLKEKNIPIYKVFMSSISLVLLINKIDLDRSIKALHQLV